jgi:hypothetical protein
MKQCSISYIKRERIKKIPLEKIGFFPIRSRNQSISQDRMLTTPHRSPKQTKISPSKSCWRSTRPASWRRRHAQPLRRAAGSPAPPWPSRARREITGTCARRPRRPRPREAYSPPCARRRSRGARSGRGRTVSLYISSDSRRTRSPTGSAPCS